MANEVDTSKTPSETRQMNGRRVIKSSVRRITRDNVVDVLTTAMNTHSMNRSEIEYLWDSLSHRPLIPAGLGAP